MKNPITLLLILFVSFTIVKAQTNTMDTQKNTVIGDASFETIYVYTVNTARINQNMTSYQNKYKQEIYTTILQGNNTVSKFWDYNLFKKDSILYSGTKNTATPDEIKKLNYLYNYKIEYLFLPVIIKNYPENAITATDEITPNDYLYREKKSKLDWKLKEDTSTVCGYRCYKAITKYGGREWIAWYSPEIAVSDGPWKLFGLPGLILKAQDATATHTFEAISIRQSERTIYLANNALRINTDRKTFIETKNKYENNPTPANNIPMDQISSFEVMRRGELTLINGKRAIMKRSTVYSPLELE